MEGILLMHGWEIWAFGMCVSVSMGLIIFSRTIGVVFGPILLILSTVTLPHATHSEAMSTSFVIERFNEGKTLECSLWRGESLLIESQNGWSYNNSIGFIKEEKSFNEPSWCRVIDETAPEPSTLPYWFLGIFLLTLSFGARYFALRGRDNTPKDETTIKEHV